MSTVQMIPVDKVHVLNPRARNKTKFAEIVDSISKIGVKKPITVCPRDGADGEYDLVCGQGRLEAVISLALTHVPALIVEATPEKRYLMGLVENLARRHPGKLALVHGIAALEKRGGYTPGQIAEKIGISEKYVRSILRLHGKGEELLLAAVERGDLSIHVAVEIATAKDDDVKKCLAEAYERGDLKGAAVSKARALIERRLANGKRARGGPSTGPSGPARPKVSTDEIVRAYKRSTQKQALLAKRAHLCESMLRIVHGALCELTQDEHFVTLLRAEKLDKMPKYLAGLRRGALS
jgi:ParB family chromosome partitioning protein